MKSAPRRPGDVVRAAANPQPPRGPSRPWSPGRSTAPGGDPAAAAVAIERPDGLVVEALLDHEFCRLRHQPQAARPLPRPLHRRRRQGRPPRRSGAGRCRELHRRAFRRVLAVRPEIVALRGLVREDDALRIEETALSQPPQATCWAATIPGCWSWPPTGSTRCSGTSGSWPPRRGGRHGRRQAVAAAPRRHRIRRLDSTR